MKIDLDNIDNDLLQELISHVEGKMSSPFKEKADKKKMDMEAMMAKEEPEVETENEEEEMDEDTLRQLMDMYKNQK